MIADLIGAKEMPAALFPRKIRSRIRFTSRAPAYLLNAIRASMLAYVKIKHLTMKDESYVCTDFSIIRNFIEALVGCIICDSSTTVGAEYAYSVQSVDSCVMLLSGNFKPILSTGAKDAAFDSSTLIGTLAPRSKIEFVGTVVEKMSMDSAVKAVESTCFFCTEEERKLFYDDDVGDGVDKIWNNRHELEKADAPPVFTMQFVVHGNDDWKSIVEEAKTALCGYLKVFAERMVKDNFIQVLAMADEDETTQTGYEIVVYEPLGHAAHLLQCMIGFDSKFTFYALHNDYVTKRFIFRFVYDGSLDAMIAVLQQKIVDTIALIGRFNL